MLKDTVKDFLIQQFELIEKITGPLTNAYLAGGCIASLVLGELPKDYDVWFENPEDFEAAISGLAKNQFEVSDHSSSKYAETFKYAGITVQLVQSRMGKPEVVVPQFDFKHTQSYMKRDGTLVYDEAFILEKKLVFVPGNFSHPVNTMQRVNKFARRGYDIPYETTRDLMLACNKLTEEQIMKSTKHEGSL